MASRGSSARTALSTGSLHRFSLREGFEGTTRTEAANGIGKASPNSSKSMILESRKTLPPGLRSGAEFRLRERLREQQGFWDEGKGRAAKKKARPAEPEGEEGKGRHPVLSLAPGNRSGTETHLRVSIEINLFLI